MHGQTIEMSNYVIERAKDTLENWQSEFLQLAWQVEGLALFFFVGYPTIKRGRRSQRSQAGYNFEQTRPRSFPGCAEAIGAAISEDLRLHVTAGAPEAFVAIVLIEKNGVRCSKI
jgi:hypothetical protein